VTGLALLLLGALRLAAGADPREALPQYQVIPAAKPEELTAANGRPVAAALTTWTQSHGDMGARRYSALTQINRGNVGQLREAWSYHSGDGQGHLQSNPIVVDGVLYAPTVGRAIVALDAATGRELWRHQLEAATHLRLEDAPARRGLMFWRGDGTAPPRVLFTCGNWIYALDPRTGRPVESFGEKGRAPLPTGGTAVGVIWRDVLVVPGFLGDIFGYDVRDGAPRWRFHTIPQAGEFGADTWQGPVREGANCWGGVSLDEERGIVFAALGAARPDFVGTGRTGDNLYSDCVVALEAATGRRLWHFQNVRHDIWDLDNTAPPNLVTVVRDGRRVDAVAAVGKTGNTLLLDRVSGKPIFPFRLRRAPASSLPGETTALYQPDPELPEPISSPEFKIGDVTSRSPEARAAVLKQIERANYGWYEPFTEGKPTLFIGTRGGAEWSGACVDVPTGRLYISGNHVLSAITVVRNDERERDPSLPPSRGETVYAQLCAGCHGPTRLGVGMAPPLVGLRQRLKDADVLELLRTGRGSMPPLLGVLDERQRADLLDYLMRRNQPAPRGSQAAKPEDPAFVGTGIHFVRDPEGYPGTKPPWGQLFCLDLNTGKIAWRVPLGEYPELTAQGIPKTGTENLGGPTVTAGGLVFCAGTKDARLRAFDADTGEELWSAQLPWAGTCAPSVYEVDGRQFVVVNASGGGKLEVTAGDAYVAFALPLSQADFP
jgi:quinoprotein glucose dehydrogenase